MLFDEIERRSTDGKTYSESDFSYLNSTARFEFAQLRDLFEKWISEYPLPNRDTFVRRFRSHDNGTFKSVFYELFMYMFLKKHGYQIEVEPSLEYSNKKPDFKVTTVNHHFYFETTSCFENVRNNNIQKIKNEIYDYINKEVKSNNIKLLISFLKTSNKKPSLNSIKEFLLQNISLLDDNAIQLLEKEKEISSFSWLFKHNDWEIRFRPLVYRQSSGNIIGMISDGVKAKQNNKSLLNTLKSKAGYYGKYNVPFILAINTFFEFPESIDNDDIVDALFGTERLQVNLHTGETIRSRAKNGLWFGPNGPVHKTISAVLISRCLNPETITISTHEIWHNPWALYPISTDIFRVKQFVINLEDCKITEKSGAKINELLDLPPNWPFV